MFASKRIASLGLNSDGRTRTATLGSRPEASDRTDRQNLLAFVIILLLSMLVFLLGGALATDAPVRQADLTADLRH